MVTKMPESVTNSLRQAQEEQASGNSDEASRILRSVAAPLLELAHITPNKDDAEAFTSQAFKCLQEAKQLSNVPLQPTEEPGFGLGQDTHPVIQKGTNDRSTENLKNLKQGAWFMGGMLGFTAGAFIGLPVVGAGAGAYAAHRSLIKSTKNQEPLPTVAEMGVDALDSLASLEEKHRITERFAAAGRAAYAELSRPTKEHKSSVAQT